MLAVFTVNNTGDFIDNDPNATTLREAIEDANSDTTDPSDEIIFSTDPADGLDGGTILLTAGELSITESVTINASMLSGGLTIDASGTGERIFYIRDSFGAPPVEAELIGLSLTNAAPTSGQGIYGGAIYFNGKSLILDQVTIAGSTDLSQRGGGAVYADLQNGDSLLIKNGSAITGNQAENGGGIYARVEDGATLEIRDSTISGNDALGTSFGGNAAGGGGVHAYVFEGGEVMISGSEISGNGAHDGGGILVNMPGFVHQSSVGSLFTLEESIVANNEAENRGGGVLLASGSGGQSAIVDSQITGNDAGLALDGNNNGELPNSGGGVYAYLFTDQTAASLTISRTQISGNTAGEHGGGLAVCAKREGSNSEKSQLEVTNTTISGNQAGHTTAANYGGTGGGVHLAIYPNDQHEALDSHFQLSTITENKAALGGGIYSFAPTQPNSETNTWLTNTIATGNIDHGMTALPSNLYGSFNLTDTRYNLIGTGSMVVSHLTPTVPLVAIIAPSAAPFDTTTNKVTDSPNLGPLMDHGGPTWTHALDCDSPALDAGDPDAEADVNVPEFDQRGLPRIYDFLGKDNSPAGQTGESMIDIGAFEFGLADLSADFDQDGDVDGFDFLAWQRGFGMADASRQDGDANGDGTVDADDLLLWSEQYGQNTTMIIDADFNEDMIVDDLDLDIWETSFGIDGAGDADMDGDTDGLDFLAWQIQFLQQTDALGEIVNLAATLQYLGDADQLVVSITADEVDGDNSLGDLSLREAVILANAATEPTTIVLPTGRYSLTRTGTEVGDASYNDLDITGNVTIIGDGPGFSTIDNMGLSGSEGRALHVNAATATLKLEQLTIANGSMALSGQAVYLTSGESLEIYDSAIVNHTGWAGGSGVSAIDTDVTIQRSVFTNNDNTSPNGIGAAVVVWTATNGGASLTLGQTVFAHNAQANGNTYQGVWANANVTKTNEGYNLYDDASGGFFDTTPGTGDYLGTPDYIVTTIEDTYDHTNNDESLSVREAIDLANTTSGAEEIWLPAWHFELTRDRGTNVYDTSIAYGDLDITDDLTVRGVDSATGSATSIAWKSGVVDDIFDLIGDFDNDGQASQAVSGSDHLVWQVQNGSGSQDESSWGLYFADADDDGDVDSDDYDLRVANYGNTLDIFDIVI